MAKRASPRSLVALVLAVAAAAPGCSGGDGTDRGPRDAPTETPADVPPDVPVALDPGPRDADRDAPPGDDSPDPADAPDGADAVDVPDAADAGPDCSETPLAPFCACDDASDCRSNGCGFLFGEKVCYATCVEDCPEGFSCELIPLGGQDPLYLCVPRYPALCLPCTNSAGCGTLSERCIAYGDGGSFCAPACESDGDCPEGYACRDATSTEDATDRRCVRAEGDCPCSAWAVQKGLSTPCTVSNEFGTCAGRRTCRDGGLSACEARLPGPEVCFNDADEDCDGVTDDAEVCLGCVCGNGRCQTDQCGEAWAAGTRTCARDCAVCGDGGCDPGEGPVACPGDCCGGCGDGRCQAATCGETAAACPADCGAPACGDGACQGGENPADCPADCARGACGNGACDPDETAVTCGADCSAACGDCMCSPPETYATCPVDCGWCGDGWCVDRCDRLYAPEDLSTCFADCCVPACGARECGSDGCGGQCGTCGGQEVCTGDGACVCVPACQGRDCGTDGCGDDCGTCGEGTVCAEGLCRAGCQTSATCAAGDECVDGACVPDLPDDARLEEPLRVESVPGQPTAALTARVVEAGVTEGAGLGAGILAQAGWGPAGTDPAADPTAWSWSNAAFLKDDGPGDVYEARLLATSAGARAFTFRFSLDNLHWAYADATGRADGYDPDALGAWDVPLPPAIGRVTPAFGTVLGGDSVAIQGAGFRSGLVLEVGGVAVTPAQVAEGLVVFTAPAHAAGPAAVTIRNPDGQSDTEAAGFEYVRRFTPTLDGDLSEWPALLEAGRNTVASGWNPATNHLDVLYVAFDAQYLYVALAGSCESQNTIVGYVDAAFGTTGGVNQMKGLHDNAGNGDLDDATCNLLEVTAAGFGAEFAFGTRGMASFRPGDPSDALGKAGWRALDPPWDLPWVVGTVVAGAGAVEAALPLATLRPDGIPAAGAPGAVFVKLVDRFGDAVGISNQTLPGFHDPAHPLEVGVVAEYDVRL